METREVVIRYTPDSKWYIAYAKSYQNAFSSKVNSFPERDGAVSFINEYNARPTRDCDMLLVWHEYDQLNTWISEEDFWK